MKHLAFALILSVFLWPGQMLQAQQMTMSALRKASPAAAPQAIQYITDPGREGQFIADPSDKTSPDDSVMVLVNADGLRLRRATDGHTLNVRWFGATGNGMNDDWAAIQKGINYILNNDRSGRELYFPPGNYKISRPLIIARMAGSIYRQATITLSGPANSRTIAAGYAQITPLFNNAFAIGVQLGKGVTIRDLTISGQFLFPHSLNNIQVDTLAFTEWTDKTVRENPLSPYAGIAIDPFSDSAVYPKNGDMYPGLHSYCPRGLGRGGSTNVQITGCSIQNFIVGVMITPSNQQNGELIDVIDCDISYNKVSYAMGQAQSKECHVTRMKCWGATHTIFDNVNYGFRHGDGAAVPMVDGVNIAGAAKQLCNISANSFSGIFRNVFAEGLFRLGYAGGNASLAFDNCQFDFSTLDPGIPYPDFYILGSGASFHDCMLRLYPGVPGARLILSGSNIHYDGGITNAPPVTFNMDNSGSYANPVFRNVIMYYSSGILGSSNYNELNGSAPLQGSNGLGTDPVYYGNSYVVRDGSNGTSLTYKLTYNSTYERMAYLSGSMVIHASKTNWTGWFKLAKAADANLLKTGDFILTGAQHYQDQFTGLYAPSYPVGIVRAVRHDTVDLVSLAYGIKDGMSLTLAMDYYVNASAPLTGDIAAGSDLMTHVQGTLPSPGTRLDMPMLVPGTFVRSVDAAAGTIRFSTPNATNQSFKDYTCMNGYPKVEIYGYHDLPYLAQHHKTLIGGADYYQSSMNEPYNHLRDDLMNQSLYTRYKIQNTNIGGDTTLHPLKFRALGTGE